MAMELVKGGQSAYRIVISAQAGPDIRYAADELAKYLASISGASLPVVEDGEAPQEKEIVIGSSNRQGAPCTAELKTDGYILKTVGNRLFILGENGRGCVYGVYGLLEAYLGCRFLAREVEVVPTEADISLPELDEAKVSPLEYRETYWYEPERFDGFAMKRGFNASITQPYGEHLGGSIQALGLAHTFFSFLSPEEFFDEHPEYFSLVGGRRIREETQLCLTNPEVKRIVKQRLREAIVAHPECKMFSVSQMDWYNPCECPECARIDAEEGSHMGTVLRFVNECADSIAEEFPDVVIETLAYQYTRQPPKITKARPNVCVCLCSIECCFTHPLRQCDRISVPFKYIAEPGATFQQDLVGWSKVCSRMMIWDYTTNYRFYLAPMINLHVLQDNMNFFLENNVTFLFEQGNAQSMSGEFGELRAYLLSKLMWEPKGDVDKWMNDFLTGYYGAGAAKPIRAYIELLQGYVTEYHVHAGIYENPMDVIPNALIPKMDALWDEAEAAAEDEAKLARIRRSRLQVKFVKQHRRRLTDADFAEEGEKLISEIIEHGIDYVQEGVARDTSFAQIRTGYLPDSWQTFWKPQPVKTAAKSISEHD